MVAPPWISVLVGLLTLVSAMDILNVASLQLQPPFGSKVKDLPYDFYGDTLVSREIQLTRDRPGQRGLFFTKEPINMDSFQVEFGFSIYGQGSTLHGDGMAIWIVEDEIQEGPVFGFKDYFKGLGIFIDTYKNNRPGKVFPHVMAMYGDGSTRYDHEHDGQANELGACSGRGLHNSGRPSSARLTYVKNGFLALELNYKGKAEWETCFVLDAKHIKFDKTVGRLGFSASTGDLSEVHELRWVEVRRLANAPTSFEEYDLAVNGRALGTGQDPSRLPKQNPGRGRTQKSIERKQSSFLWRSFKYLLVVLGMVAGYAAFSMYRIQQRSRSRRGHII